MAKRGRKPGSKKNKKYWGEDEENAVVNYNLAETAEEKDKIYNTILKPAFTIMVESIIRRYHLYGPGEEYQETFDDTLSFMLTKMSCFNPSRGTKAYSYCGTIAKNYLIQKITQYTKKIERTIPMHTEIEDKIENNIKYSEGADESTQAANDLILEMSKQVRKVLDNSREGCLNPNEAKVGYALCELLEHWEEILNEDIQDKEASNKFNKSSVLYFLRETTGLDTKEVRDGMKHFKELYKIIKHKYLS